MDDGFLNVPLALAFESNRLHKVICYSLARKDVFQIITNTGQGVYLVTRSELERHEKSGVCDDDYLPIPPQLEFDAASPSMTPEELAERARKDERNRLKKAKRKADKAAGKTGSETESSDADQEGMGGKKGKGVDGSGDTNVDEAGDANMKGAPAASTDKMEDSGDGAQRTTDADSKEGRE